MDYDGSTDRSQAPQRIYQLSPLIIEATHFLHKAVTSFFVPTVAHPFIMLSAVYTGRQATDAYVRPSAIGNYLLDIF